METKLCPYCGEEILTTAKKCKHCGEWLEPKDAPESTTLSDNTSVSTSTETAAQTEPDSVNYKKIISLCWVVTVSSVLYLIAVFNNRPKLIIGEDVNMEHGSFIIPQWLICIILGVSLFTVLMSLSEFCRKKNFTKTPLIAMACIVAIKYFIFFMETITNDSFILLFIIFFIAEVVLGLIAGIKFYNSPITRQLGIGFMLYAIFLLVALIYNLFINDDFNHNDIILGLGYTIANIILMLRIKKQIKSEIPSDSDINIYSKAK